jgi:hypothetical protein
MIRRWKDIQRLALHGSDGPIGVIDDALVDDRWVVRYLVVAPASLMHQRVAISPIHVSGIDWAREVIELRLTRAQARESPDLLSVTPMTREAEWAYASYYGFPAYWGGPDLWGAAGHPGALAGPAPESHQEPAAATGASPLHGTKGLRGRHLAALDGRIGHVDDAFLDEDSWSLTCLLVDTSNWIGGRHVLLPTSVVPLAAAGADLVVDRTVEAIREAPGYDAAGPLDASTARAIAEHYGRTTRGDAAGAGSRPGSHGR